MPEVPHDETVALRLELGRERDRANALEAALRKEVLAIVRDGIAEYERLKTDIYRLRHERIRDLNTYGGQQEEIARLKAEIERLRKAGDAMQKRLIFLHDRWDSDEPNIESDAWNAAKEGKQP